MHARTTRIGYYSYIEKMAIMIGDDVLEFENDVTDFLVNGKKHNMEEELKFGGFSVWLTKRAISVRLQTGPHKKAHIDFYERINGMKNNTVKSPVSCIHHLSLFVSSTSRHALF